MKFKLKVQCTFDVELEFESRLDQTQAEIEALARFVIEENSMPIRLTPTTPTGTTWHA